MTENMANATEIIADPAETEFLAMSRAYLDRQKGRITELERAAARLQESPGAERIVAERARQIEAEGWTPGHDAEHTRAELARAAVCYATPPELRHLRGLAANVSADRGSWFEGIPVSWPWHPGYWKPSPDDRIRELVKAGGLIAAEIDRLIARERAQGHHAVSGDAGTGNARGADGRGPENCPQPRAGDAP